MPFKEGIRMSFSEVKIDEVKPKLEIIFSRYGCLNKLSTFILNKSFYELKGKYNQLFMLANNVNNIRLSEFLSSLLSKGFHPYSVGTPIIIYDKSEILPTLAFGRYLAEMCENKLVISDYNLIYKIIYKRPIYINSIYNYNNDVIIVDKMSNFIAYAKVKNRKRGVYEVIPVKDIGWYLRRGG
ncbi:hypothetical protein [Sulfolobus sp. E11-6]|uniref:hypothetical protein n=1 Tax=Sulfolobus sp. E11-6 TaxID=2663020 RepID=UPI0012951EAD|nr:hypothetical protein [Sulfolobus sp. E11-6]QGA67780.1 hypothetical protein GFS33_02175 [Sulfolobus sp. E11-6]